MQNSNQKLLQNLSQVLYFKQSVSKKYASTLKYTCFYVLDKKPTKNWPSRGEIQFKDYYLAYEDKDVVKGLNFTIRGQEKIGIVGRTGAGKSSIIAGLFRMTEPRGDLLIDGVRVNDIGLHDLRKNISIIPQDPVLFSGTMRYNLDPFDQFQDNELWSVITEVCYQK